MKPVNTITDRMMMPDSSEYESAACHVFERTKKPRIPTMATAIMISGHFLIPLPNFGRRSTTWLRSGRPRPLTTSTTMITMNEMMVSDPVRSCSPKKLAIFGCQRRMTLWPIPRIMPPSIVRGKERNPPTSAAARPEMVTTRTKPTGSRPVIGPRRIPEIPANADPTPQVIAPR